MKPDIKSLVNSEDPDQLASSRSAGFLWSQLVKIHTVFNATCELVIINQNTKYYTIIDFNEVDMRIYLDPKKW